MLIRLMKYELMAAVRVVPVLWIIVLLLAVLNGAAIFGNLFMVAGVYPVIFIVFLLVLIAMVFAVLVSTAIRFYRSMVTDEGYLTHMLPVKPWELLTAKLLSALFWVLATMAVYLCAVLLLGAVLPIVNLSTVLAETGFADLNWPLMILVQILSTARGLLQLYTTILIGGFSDNHKLLCSILAYLGISLAVNLLFSFWGLNTAGLAATYTVGDAVVQITYTAGSLKSILAELILGACFFFSSRGLIANQVNLT